MEEGVQTYLLQVSAGKEHAFRALITLYGPSLHHFAFHMLGNREEAEEAVSDVFLKVWLHRDNLPPAPRFKYYLFKAVKNTAVNYLKSSGRRMEHYSSWKMEVFPPLVHTPEDIVISKENIQCIREAVNALPSRCRQIFILVKEEGLSYAQVADLLEISPATVNVQMTIAVRRIWEALTPLRQISGS